MFDSVLLLRISSTSLVEKTHVVVQQKGTSYTVKTYRFMSLTRKIAFPDQNKGGCRSTYTTEN